MAKLCRNMSVGVIIRDRHGRMVMLERLNEPKGWACVAGHVEDAKGTDDKEAFMQSGVREVLEEIGLDISEATLTPVAKLRIGNNPCSRGAKWHDWIVFEVLIDDIPEDLQPREEDREKIGEIRVLSRDAVAALDLEYAWWVILANYKYIKSA